MWRRNRTGFIRTAALGAPEARKTDKLDTQILKQLADIPASSPAQSDVRKSMRAVARKIGVSETAVRERVSRMRSTGFLKGWTPFINPNLLGLNLSLIWFDSRVTPKQALLKKLLLMHGVGGILDCLGTRVGMVLFYESPESLKRSTELIARISESDNLTHSEARFPPTNVRLTPTDLKILKSFHEGPERTFKDIGREWKLSSRTVRRRIHHLTESFALFAVPSIDPKKIEGAIVAGLVVDYEKPEAKMAVDSAVRSEFADLIVSSQSAMAERGAFTLVLNNVGKAREVQSWTSQLPGVKTSRVDIIEDMIQRFDWFKESLQRMVEAQPEGGRKETLAVLKRTRG